MPDRAAGPDGEPLDTCTTRQVGLVLVLAILLDGVLRSGTLHQPVLSTFYWALAVHVPVSIYVGEFGRLRTMTWSLLIGSWMLLEAISFFSFVLPSGQATFWAGSFLAGIPWVGEHLATALPSALRLVAADFPYALLVLDLAVMHAKAWRRATTASVLLGLAGVVAAALFLNLAADFARGALLVPGPEPAELSVQRVPDWYTLPFYAFLYVVRSKVGGLLLCASALLALQVVPWIEAERLRAGRLRNLWRLSCLAWIGSWIGLALYGYRPYKAAGLLAIALVAYHFAFLLVVPSILRRLSQPRSGDA